jgi:hypothetical protein
LQKLSEHPLLKLAILVIQWHLEQQHAVRISQKTLRFSANDEHFDGNSLGR